MTFAAWWFQLEMKNLARLRVIDPVNQDHYVKQQRMVWFEGIAWELLLLAGGGTLIYLVNRERKQNQQVKEFFASFSHDVKTSLASLRLQAEALKEDLGDLETPLLSRLVSDTVRLQLQLENSLYFSAQDSLSFFMEDIDFARMVESLKHQWPTIAIEVTGPKRNVRADERALKSVLSNLIQNSLIHGKAKSLKFEIQDTEIKFADDGTGFTGEVQKLGRIFHRPTTTSGSGLGLYISKSLLVKMNGDLSIQPQSQGFGGSIRFEGTRV